MVEAIVFDIGNVLLRFDFGLTLRRIAPFCDVPATEIPGQLEDLKVGLESGRVDSEAFLQAVTETLGYRGERGLLVQAWQEIFTPIESMHSLVEQLRGRRRLYLLSNTNQLHADYFLARYPVFGLFEDAVYSHKAGLMKPDAAIYAHTQEKCGLDPARTLFIDDLAPNVESAAQAGWRTHHYAEARHGSLLEQLSALGVL